MTSRQATHAGTWYSDRRSELDDQLSAWLTAVPVPLASELSVPVKDLKAIIAPHAGYRFSGPSAAYAYKAIDPSRLCASMITLTTAELKANSSRIFILGPSHHIYLDGCAVSRCTSYETPLGDLLLDVETIDELRATGHFDDMRHPVDEDEHSIEMHLPYLRKVFEGRDVRVVPVLVGSLATGSEKQFGALFAPYLADPETLFVISSDFCHWGSRFNYTYYKDSDGRATQLSRRHNPTGIPIYASIEALDQRGMETISGSHPSDSHAAFAAYLSETRNTICGRHPIGVLLATLACLPDPARSHLTFVHYEQSSRCRAVGDSSVSYASAVITVM